MSMKGIGKFGSVKNSDMRLCVKCKNKFPASEFHEHYKNCNGAKKVEAPKKEVVEDVEESAVEAPKPTKRTRRKKSED